MLIRIVLLFVCIGSFGLSQGMYVLSKDKPVYSLNLLLSSFNGVKEINNQERSDYKNFYGLGLSAVLQANNELGVLYKASEGIKSINLSYLYYIKPDFYINMFLGTGYEHIDKNLSENESQYNLKLGLYGRSKKKTGLKYFPFFSYDYIYHNIPTNENISDNCTKCEYDIITIGCSMLFNDIGIEPSYKWIDKNTHEFSIKLYLWEFGS